MGLYDELLEPSSTLTPGQVQTKTVITEKIEIQEDTLTGISQDYLDTGTTEVPSSKALYEAFFRLQDNIEKVDPLKKLLIDTTVITLPLLPTSFDYNDTSWDYNHWYIDREKIVYNGIYEDNYIKINPTDFTYPGTYFLCIKISSIDSGYLQVLNGTNDILATYIDKGSQYLQVDFVNTDAQSLIIKAVDTRKDNKIKIDSIGIYRVTERLQDYLDYFVSHHNSAGVSKEEVNEEFIKGSEWYSEYVEQINNGKNSVVNNNGNVADVPEKIVQDITILYVDDVQYNEILEKEGLDKSKYTGVDKPKASASATIKVFAFGISMPFSIIVVATKTFASCL